MTPPFVKIGTANQKTYADEPIITTIVDDSPEASVRKYRVQVTATDISGSAVEAYNQIWSANTPFDLQGVMTPYLNWGIDFANSFFLAKGTGALQQILVVNATLITDETIQCHDWAMVMHARWNKALTGNKTLEEYAIQHHIFLTHRKQRYVTTDSPEWLTYSRFGHSSNQDNYPLTVRCKIYYTNGSVGVVDKGTIGADQIDRNIACGFKQFGLDKEANEVDSYEVYLVDLTHGTSSQTFVVHSEKITFIVDYNAYENKRYIVFRNSLGGFDTLLFTGVFDNEIEVNSVTSVGVEAGTVKLKKEGVNVSRLITARTGAQSLSDIPYLTSEFFSTERVYLIEDNAITEMVLVDGTYTAAPEDGRVVNLEVNLSAANLGDSTMMLMSLASPEVPESQVTIVSHNHDNIYYRKEYVDTEMGKRALVGTVDALAKDMQALITTTNDLLQSVNSKAEKDFVVSAVKTASDMATTAQTKANEAVNTAEQALTIATAAPGAALSTLRDGVANEGDTLKKLYQALQTLTSVVSSDDVNLDTVREIVAFIKNNKDVIDTISTSKVSINDIVDDLLSTATNRPLSANQGKVLKGIVDSLANSQTIAAKSILLSVCFSDAQEANISFPAAATIKKISWDASAFTSVQAGVGAVSTAANGNTISIAVAAGSALNLKVAFATGKTIGSLILEGNYN